jgi:hypothetical protein
MVGTGKYGSAGSERLILAAEKRAKNKKRNGKRAKARKPEKQKVWLWVVGGLGLAWLFSQGMRK